MSSYSYMILPKDTSPDSHFNTEKGKTLSEFAAYFLCEGQQQADTLGYSPLPINLVQDGVDQINQIPGSTKKLDRNNLTHCNNPTVSPDGGNLVAENAPQPSPCDKQGAPTQCAIGTGGAPQNTANSGGSNGGAASGANGGTAGGTNGGTTGGINGGASNPIDPSGGTVAGGSTAGGVIDPNTGQVIGGSSAGGSGSSDVTALPVSVDAADNRRQIVLGVLAAVLLLALVLGPPLVARTMRARSGLQE
jgi:phosphate transport system substrate-binding protein